MSGEMSFFKGPEQIVKMDGDNGFGLEWRHHMLNQRGRVFTAANAQENHIRGDVCKNAGEDARTAIVEKAAPGMLD